MCTQLKHLCLNMLQKLPVFTTFVADFELSAHASVKIDVLIDFQTENEIKIRSINAGNSNYIRPKELEKRDKIQELWEKYEHGETDQNFFLNKQNSTASKYLL